MVEYICEMCLKKWIRKSDYIRHTTKKKPCKIKNVEFIEDKYDILIQQISEIKQQNSELKAIIDDINNKKATIKNNNKVLNIFVSPVAFGKEDLSFIDDKTCKKILSKGFNSIPELIKFVHFNEEKPEYHNIYIPNWRDKSNILVFDGVRWNLRDKETILVELKEKGIDYIQRKYEELDENDNNDAIIIKKIKRFLNSYDKQEEINVIINNDLLLILYNNRELIKKQ